ncbi:hypothetical protein BH10ACI4_BH10ACI4_26680 [soil metagenome]
MIEAPQNWSLPTSAWTITPMPNDRSASELVITHLGLDYYTHAE